MIAYDWRRCPPPVEPIDPTVARDYGPFSADIGPRLFSNPPVFDGPLCDQLDSSPCCALAVVAALVLFTGK